MTRVISLPAILTAVLACIGPGAQLHASQAPLSGDAIYAPSESAHIKYEWRAEAARVALESGLSAIAADMFRALFEDSDVPEAYGSKYKFDYVAALIAQGRQEEASEVLDSIPGVDRARRNLYEACILYGKGTQPDFAAIREELSVINANELRELDLPWFYLLKGVLANADGDLEEAKEFFQSAEDAAANSMQAAMFSGLVLRQKLFLSKANESSLAQVREKFESFAGQAAAFPFLQEYVVILHNLGRDAEAIGALERELAKVNAEYSIEQRASLLLLKGLILGPNSSAGWASLKELVRAGIDSEATVIALQLLGSVENREAELLSLLTEIINRAEPHPLIAQIYYARCQLALANPETTELAEEDALTLLEQFPGLAEISSVYRLLAYAALQRDQPRYRVAADYLLNLRDQTSGPKKVATLNRLIGDCYFLNRDYANAVDFYETGISETEIEAGDSTLFLRLVISQIRSGQLEAAIVTIDEADFADKINETARWRAEWNIALALQSEGDTDLALERIRSLINRGTVAIPASLDLRLQWLEAHISLQLGQHDAVSERLEKLLSRIASMPANALGADESARLKSELLLLQAKSLIAQDDAEAGFGILKEIREDFPNSIAAERTYFTEAAYHASVGDFRSAQQVLTSFTSQYPESKLAPQALFQAALHCQRRGADSYGEAVVLLDRLVQDYPEDELVYYSGLRQGDLLRLMNDFAGAQLIYENLINSFPAHELRYATELSLADCIAALSVGSGDQLVEATSILERLVDRPDLPVEVQIEAGYKWGTILLRNKDASGAKTVYGLIAGRYLLDPQNVSGLSSVGLYWLSRTVFSLCDLLEEEEELDEAGKLYRKIVAYNLPGRKLALSRLDRLQLAESP